MSARRTRWQRLGQVLVGLTAGVICLVMWSGSASAADVPPAPTPPPPSLASSLGGLLTETTATLDEALQPLGVGLAPVVGPVADQLVVPTAATVETTFDGLTQPLTPVPPLPTLPVLPAVPQPPIPPSLPDLGGVVGEPAEAAPVALPAGALDGAEVVDATPAGSVVGSSTTGRSGSETPIVAAPGHDLIESASVEGGSSSGPAFPTPAPLVEAALGTLASTGTSASTGLVLLAVLVGFAAVAANPLSRRLALAGPLSPRTLAHAIATPPG